MKTLGANIEPCFTAPMRVSGGAGTHAPTPQELPECARYPDRKCPGECQYILPAHECIHDRGPEAAQ